MFKLPKAAVVGMMFAAAAATVPVAHASGGFQQKPLAPAWHHNTSWAAQFDRRALRRGYEVYRQICSTCHSMRYIHFRNLVDITHTEAQAKMIAQTYEYVDGPNDQGEMFERKGALNDAFPAPYANEEQGRMANGGAFPPDLSLMAKARPGGEDYIFSLLTGYKPVPAGISLRSGLHYNPYFPDGAIAMGPPITEENLIEYEDGTVATVPQMAADVSTFLTWTAEPLNDERKFKMSKFMVGLAAASAFCYYYKVHRWSTIKNRRMYWIK
jgi:ubiquinol-cytochrome c reductase cytochrome c1 subunit